MILYKGPSAIDGSPIVVIATRGSKNRKTGPMIQTWILADTGDSPAAHAARGSDVSVCGDCPHRGRVEGGRNVGRSCYVTLVQAPRGVYAAYRAGSYATWDGVSPPFPGKRVRVGAYGDPGAVPDAPAFWSRVLQGAAGWTGYTHRWRDTGEGLQALVMASCDSLGDYKEAKARGWRTFRVTGVTGDLLPSREVLCPASPEAGSLTTCERCGLCQGTTSGARDVAIVIHGTGKKHFVGRKLPTL